MVKLRDAFAGFLQDWQVDLSPAWRAILDAVGPDLTAISSDLTLADNETIFPGRKGRPAPGARTDSHVFRALDAVDPPAVRAVVLGQDPYPKASRATGRAFEQGDLPDWSPNRAMVAESLRRIVQMLAYKRSGNAEYVADDAAWRTVVEDIASDTLDISAPRALFDRWQDAGVLFLNAGLTLSRFEPAVQQAHIALWRPVVKKILTHLATRPNGRIVFLLWGQVARRTFDKLGIEDAAGAAGAQDRLAIASHAHPGAEGADHRPLFFQPPNPFADANAKLAQIGGSSIDW